MNSRLYLDLEKNWYKSRSRSFESVDWQEQTEP